jgi:hypothetical protein
MNRILSIALLLLATMPALATDRFNQDPQRISIATTGRIVRVDLKAGTLKVRGSETVRNVPEMRESLWQRLGVRMPAVRVPGITISLPGRTAKNTPAKPAPDALNLNEYTVLTTDDTVFQDGIDSLRLEDFRSGETISIHGVLDGSTLKASRIAKWD